MALTTRRPDPHIVLGCTRMKHSNLPGACFRDPSYLYALRSHTDYWFAVGRSNSTQALFGEIGESFVWCLFTPFGDLMRSGSCSAKLPHAPNLTAAYAAFEEACTHFRHQHGLVDEGIKVKRFFVPEFDVGICDLPEGFDEDLCNPSVEVSAETVEFLADWKRDELYVFWWGGSFFVDSTGYVTSS